MLRLVTVFVQKYFIRVKGAGYIKIIDIEILIDYINCGFFVK